LIGPDMCQVLSRLGLCRFPFGLSLCRFPFGLSLCRFPFGLSLSKPFDKLRANGSIVFMPDQ
jgi:hypothetical protein